MAKKSRLIGKTVGSYRILKPLGQGGMGEVFLAEHPVIRSRVAIKVLHARYLTDANVVKRFIDEARAVNTISHPGIVRIHDCRRLDDVGVYLVMELLEGESLLDKLRREGRQSPRFTARLLQQVGSALVIAHKAGIVHRDLKPANIFLVPDEDLPGGVRAKVLDFGVAKLKHDPAMDQGSTVTGAVFGSPRYMSPEQCLDTKNVDARSDVYSLAAIAYEMLTERAPYEAETLGKLVLQHQTGKPPQLSRLNFKVPAKLSELIMAGVAVKPDDRISTMRELRNEIATLRWVDEDTLTNTPASEESQATWEFELPLDDDDGEDTPRRPKTALDKLKELATKDLAPPVSDEKKEKKAKAQEPDEDEGAEEEPAVEVIAPSPTEPPAPEAEPEPAPLLPPIPSQAADEAPVTATAKLTWPVSGTLFQHSKGTLFKHRKGALASTLRRGQRPTLLILAAVTMLIGGGRLMGAALDTPQVSHAESRKSPTLRGCMGVPLRPDAPFMAPLAPTADKKKTRKGAAKKELVRVPAPPAEGCYLSSEMLFLGLSKAMPGGASPRGLALARALLLLLAAGLFTVVLGRWSARAALTNSLLFALILTDPASLLWLGSFHLEFAHVLFLYLVMALAIVVSQYSDGLGWHVLLGLSLAMAGMAQTHHRYLPMILGVLIFLLLAGTHRRKAGRALVIYMVFALGVLVVQGQSLEKEGPAKQQARAGSTSVVLGAILDAFDDLEVGTERLGLSPNCTAHAGVDGHALDLRTYHPCPDVMHMKQGKVAGTLMSYPSVAVKVLDRGLAHARPWVSGKLKNSPAGEEPGGLSAILEALPEAAFRLLIALLFLGTLATLGRVLLSVLMGADPMGGVGVIILLSAAAGMEVFVASLFSQGYVNLDRHTHVMATALMVCCSMGLVALVREILHRVRGTHY